MHIPLHHPADLDEPNRRITSERAALQRDRYRAVRLALDHLQTMDIAQRLGRSRDFAQTWAYAYRDGGIDATLTRTPVGMAREARQPNRRADDGACGLAREGA